MGLLYSYDVGINDASAEINCPGDTQGVEKCTMSVESEAKTKIRAELATLRSRVDHLEEDRRILQASETRYRALFETAPDAIFLVCRNTVTECNHNALTLFGCTRDQVIGKQFLALSPFRQPCGKNSRSEAVRKINTALSGKPLVFEWKCCHCDGSPFDAEISLVRMDVAGKTYVIAFARDISGRKLTEETLRKSQQRFSDIIDFLPDATFVIDREGKVIAWNRVIEEMTGVHHRDILGKGDYAYAVPFYGKPRPILVDLVMKDGPDFMKAYDITGWKGTSLYAEVFTSCVYQGRGAHLWGTASPLFDANGNLIGAIESIRDITERKMLESELRDRETELGKRTLQLEEINMALSVLLKRREEDKKDLEESILTNVKELVLPSVEKLKKSRLDDRQRLFLNILESHLGEITSPFLKHLSTKFIHLTPMEIQVANLIKQGKISKEMAEILGISEKTVMVHRHNLRAKLGLENKKVNLRSYLMSTQ